MSHREEGIMRRNDIHSWSNDGGEGSKSERKTQATFDVTHAAAEATKMRERGRKIDIEREILHIKELEDSLVKDLQRIHSLREYADNILRQLEPVYRNEIENKSLMKTLPETKRIELENEYELSTRYLDWLIEKYNNKRRLGIQGAVDTYNKKCDEHNNSCKYRENRVAKFQDGDIPPKLDNREKLKPLSQILGEISRELTQG